LLYSPVFSILWILRSVVAKICPSPFPPLRCHHGNNEEVGVSTTRLLNADYRALSLLSHILHDHVSKTQPCLVFFLVAAAVALSLMPTERLRQMPLETSRRLIMPLWP
jgi:hypothetical protein